MYGEGCFETWREWGGEREIWKGGAGRPSWEFVCGLGNFGEKKKRGFACLAGGRFNQGIYTIAATLASVDGRWMQYVITAYDTTIVWALGSGATAAVLEESFTRNNKSADWVDR